MSAVTALHAADARLAAQIEVTREEVTQAIVEYLTDSNARVKTWQLVTIYNGLAQRQALEVVAGNIEADEDAAEDLSLLE